ncbi:hypothetical protein F4809DRAFT_641847 [Biscogniauxia mediterranea]|nr:hypothetical protein F4809DRAFT_641847 [Biscogniauxia mediterranea]
MRSRRRLMIFKNGVAGSNIAGLARCPFLHQTLGHGYQPHLSGRGVRSRVVAWDILSLEADVPPGPPEGRCHSSKRLVSLSFGTDRVALLANLHLGGGRQRWWWEFCSTLGRRFPWSRS